MSQVPQTQIPGIYRRRIGDIVITAIADGFLDGNLEVLRNIDTDIAADILAANHRPARRTAVNTFLIHTAGRTVLMETGCGPFMQATAGRQIANLAAAGVTPDDIDAILLTHMHPDHSAGLTDKETGQRIFENAELIVHENEPRHWNDDGAMAKGNDVEKSLFFQLARDQMAPYMDRMNLFSAEGEVLPGITAVPRPGHTPGHTTFLIESGDDQLLIWGDTVHIPEVQTARPEACMAFDTDTTQAETSRRAVFDMAATDGLLVTGMHLHFPGFSRLVRDGSGYRLLPEAWQHDL